MSIETSATSVDKASCRPEAARSLRDVEQENNVLRNALDFYATDRAFLDVRDALEALLARIDSHFGSETDFRMDWKEQETARRVLAATATKPVGTQGKAQQTTAEAQAMTRKIITTFVYPPIPIRGCDWQAHFYDDEPDDEGRMLVGIGATEQDAINDLLDTAQEQPRE